MLSQPSSERSGSIYDLGYRAYQGPRLGRPYAVLSLYLATLRAAFGLGRRASAKVIPIALVIVAALPAVIQLGVAAATSNDVETLAPEGYFAYVQVVLALFVAAVAPELVGRDQRNRTLSLYFSRPLTRSDYAFAKLAALATAMLALTLLPQTVMFTGNALAGTDWATYVKDNSSDIPAIIASSVLLSLFTASIALAIAAQTSRRAFAVGGVIAAFVLSSAIGGTLTALVTDNGDNPGKGYPIFLSLYDVMRGTTYWIFRAEPGQDDILANADLPGVLYAVALVATTAVAAGLLWRRYERVSP